MRGWLRYIPVYPASRCVRPLVILAVMPALTLSPLTTEAILIHYDGHDIHTHAVGMNDRNGWVETEEHHHSHEHDCQMSDPHEHGEDFLILLDLPDALLRLRGLGSGSAIDTSMACAPSTGTLAGLSLDRCPSLSSSAFLAFPAHPPSAVAGILLTNHALLL